GDGLALSSRNVHLKGADRDRALALSQALWAAERAVGAGERDAERIRAAALAAMAPHQVEPEYLALVDPDTLAPQSTVNGPLLVGDLPFGSYEASDEHAIATAHRFVKEAGCDAVKLEGGGTMAQRARAIVNAGVPVMGHVGLTPQTATALGGYRAQGRTAQRARQVLEDALDLQEAGC